MKTQLSKKIIAALVIGSFITASLQSCQKESLSPTPHVATAVDSLQNDVTLIFNGKGAHK